MLEMLKLGVLPMQSRAEPREEPVQLRLPVHTDSATAGRRLLVRRVPETLSGRMVDRRI